MLQDSKWDRNGCPAGMETNAVELCGMEKKCGNENAFYCDAAMALSPLETKYPTAASIKSPSFPWQCIITIIQQLWYPAIISNTHSLAATMERIFCGDRWVCGWTSMRTGGDADEPPCRQVGTGRGKNLSQCMLSPFVFFLVTQSGLPSSAADKFTREGSVTYTHSHTPHQWEQHNTN